ncbi:MAG: BON domain-containing protein, partial [candidate division Zixibacteria bacterium]|nr:BON domain-containing protein [candidate division Zixibacteria bacterium]
MKTERTEEGKQSMSTYMMNASFRGVGRVLAVALCISIAAVLVPMNGEVSAQADESSAVKEIDDSKIATAVATHLLAEEDVASHLIDVEVVDGVVTLDGTVNNLLARERATSIAEAVKGVRSVVNNTEVSTPARPDNEIAEDVREAIMLDPAADSYEINVTAFNGLVTLTGQVDS